MISLENPLFSAIATSLRSSVSGVYVTGEYVPSPPQFPAVSIVEIDNYPYKRTRTNQPMEHQAVSVFEVNVYSNKTKGKKAECKAIAALIDDEFMSRGFERVSFTPIQNMNDATIYRMTGRYRGVVGEDGNGNFIVYRM